MIRLLDHLDDRFTLDLLAATRPLVQFLPPVPLEQIPVTTNTHDLGLYLLEPTNFNHRHALPNKFFEFIQARLGVAIGPSPEMSRIVRTFRCGLVASDFRPDSLARELNALTSDAISRFKKAGLHAADVLCWEHEGEKLRRIIRQLLAGTPCAG